MAHSRGPRIRHLHREISLIVCAMIVVVWGTRGRQEGYRWQGCTCAGGCLDDSCWKTALEGDDELNITCCLGPGLLLCEPRGGQQDHYGSGGVEVTWLHYMDVERAVCLPCSCFIREKQLFSRSPSPHTPRLVLLPIQSQ